MQSQLANRHAKDEVGVTVGDGDWENLATKNMSFQVFFNREGSRFLLKHLEEWYNLRNHKKTGTLD